MTTSQGEGYGPDRGGGGLLEGPPARGGAATEHRAVMTDEELKVEGVRALIEALGDVQAARFVSLLTRAQFDYTKWQRGLWADRGTKT